MLSAGIVGLPNVGKSTLFNAVTRTHKAPAENYPFCTIDPNVGVVTVPDPRLEKIAEISHSKKITPTAIEFVDIAGLVKGASAGEGLGNQFLHHIREVDAIVQVVRCFENPDVHHVSATIDPIRDIEVINTELVLADLASLQRRHDRLHKQLHAGDKTAKIENAIIEKLSAHLDAGKPAITADLTPEEKAIARGFFLLTSKPTIFACNVAESDLAAISTGDQGSAAEQHLELVQDYARHHFATEAIVQVVRCFENPDVHHVSATIDPIRDIEVINTELVLADLASLQRRHDRLQKQLHAGDKTAKIENANI
jgi:GTP-binding protein YchF